MKTKYEIEVDEWIKRRKERGYNTFEALCWQITFSYGPKPEFYSSRYGAATPKEAIEMFNNSCRAEIRDQLSKINSYMNELQETRWQIAAVQEMQIPKGYK
jgi:hypothetical protein